MKWEKELKAALQAAELASQKLLQVQSQIREIRIKPDAGLVSRADEETEALISEHLKPLGFGFLGEEAGLQIQNEDRWIVDPLDGTTNYLHRFPFYCTSIALFVDGAIRVGVVFAPELQQRFWAVEGQGAFQNGSKIQVRQESNLSQTFLGTGFYYMKDQDLDRQVQSFRDLIPLTHGIRRAGAAALDLCYVANGIFDGFWERGLKPWDTAAGVLMVSEAGGKNTDYNGNPYLFQDTLVAASMAIHDPLLGRLKKCLV